METESERERARDRELYWLNGRCPVVPVVSVLKRRALPEWGMKLTFASLPASLLACYLPHFRFPVTLPQQQQQQLEVDEVWATTSASCTSSYDIMGTWAIASSCLPAICLAHKCFGLISLSLSPSLCPSYVSKMPLPIPLSRSFWHCWSSHKFGTIYAVPKKPCHLGLSKSATKAKCNVHVDRSKHYELSHTLWRNNGNIKENLL